MEKLRVVDLFCGCGGMSLGFSAAGCSISLGVDHDSVAAETFLANFLKIQPEDPPAVIAGLDGDVSELDLPRVRGEAPDVLIGGPPCQGFSRVGRAKLRAIDPEGFHADPRNDLYMRFLDAAEQWRPRAVVMENVPGMLNIGGVNVALLAASDLADRGFSVGYARLNAVWYGVPQYRERFIMIGIRDDLGRRPTMPSATHDAALPSGYLAPIAPNDANQSFSFTKFEELPVDLSSGRSRATSAQDALDDLPRVTDHLRAGEANRVRNLSEDLKYWSNPHSDYAKLMRAWPGLQVPQAVTDQFARRTPRDYETFRRMKPGDRYPEALEIAHERLSEALSALSSSAPVKGSREYDELSRTIVPPYPVDRFVDKWRKLIPDQPSWTVPAHLAKDSYSHIHYDGEQARAITIREAARLQSFPDAFTFAGNMGDRFRQIGNAVPPMLAYAIAAEVMKTLGVAPADLG